MSDILFIKTSSLGDVIHHMPALTEARRRLPDARFSWVVEEAFAPLVRLHPAVGHVIPIAARRWRASALSPSTWTELRRFARSLRERRYDAIIDSQGLFFKSALVACLARGRRHGYDAQSIREPAAAWLYDVRHRIAFDLHAIARNRLITAQALGYPCAGAPDFGLAREKLVDRAAQRYAILLHATARPEKEWPEARWIALGQLLEGDGTELLLPWGSEAERLRSERIAAALGHAHVPERRPLDRMTALIAGAAYVVGVDTGLLHLAGALGVPLVAIFSGSEPGLTGPMGQGSMAVVGGKGHEPSVDDVSAALARVR
jgi:heptosyltransferase-1